MTRLSPSTAICPTKVGRRDALSICAELLDECPMVVLSGLGFVLTIIFAFGALA